MTGNNPSLRTAWYLDAAGRRLGTDIAPTNAKSGLWSNDVTLPAYDPLRNPEDIVVMRECSKPPLSTGRI